MRLIYAFFMWYALCCLIVLINDIMLIAIAHRVKLQHMEDRPKWPYFPLSLTFPQRLCVKARFHHGTK